jgi:hypothetical protein
MRRRKKAVDAKTVLFKLLYGVKPDTFEKMPSVLQKEYHVLQVVGERCCLPNNSLEKPEGVVIHKV